jgi:hypothetical protein
MSEAKMFLFRVGYRGDRGQVEGFVGLGISPELAESDAMEQIAQQYGQVCETRLLLGAGSLTPGQILQLQADWQRKQQQRVLPMAVIQPRRNSRWAY